jgi:CheY-like chemotaxis protein
MRTLLIVEDDKAIRELLETVLKEEGYQTLVAGNGNEALACLTTHTVDLVVSDIMMPGLDGLELLVALRKEPDHAHLPVVLMSAANRPAMLGTFMGVRFLSKPFDLDYLTLTIAQVLDASQQMFG